MCGIAAIISRVEDPCSEDLGTLHRMCAQMASRGPDDSGTWQNSSGRVVLGHRRLATVDLTTNARQPMVSADGRLAIVFNGEIYNHRELRAALEARGYRFRSSSDTEVLLHLYAEKGEAMVHELRGMFAFAIWDADRQGLFAARDPFGIKPLYYADDGHKFHLASQVKALLAATSIDTAPDSAGHVGYFLWGYVPDPYTLYRGIRALPAGTTLWVTQDGERRIREYCNIPRILAEAETRTAELSLAARREELREALVDSVRCHLMADVPVGIFLSAGLDSGTMAGLSAEHGGSLRTVTLGFAEYRNRKQDETRLAEQVASQYGTRHETIWISREDFEEHRERFLDVMDQPSIDGLNTYFVSLAARRAGLKVALSGLGGDEIFAGYPSFQDIPPLVRVVSRLPGRARWGRRFRLLAGPMMRRFTSPKYAGLFEYGGSYSGAYLLRRGLFMPWELTGILDPEVVRQGWRELQPLLRFDEILRPLRNSRLQVTALETCWYMRHQLLRDSDWASMAHSLELRVPLVDLPLLRRVAPLLASRRPPGKRDMAETPTVPLPVETFRRPKTGFTTPLPLWLQRGAVGRCRDRGLREWARQVYAHSVERKEAAPTNQDEERRVACAA